MKTRLSFVANSSSSSFILFGIKIKDKDIEKFLEKLGFDLSEYDNEEDKQDCIYINLLDGEFDKDGLEYLDDDSTIYYGLILENTQEQLKYGEVNIQKLIEVKEKLPEAKLYYGTRSC